MSGPMSGDISVDWSSYEQSAAVQQQNESSELIYLEGLSSRDQTQDLRRAQLEDRARRRREREAELAEAARKRALESYQRTRAQLDTALSKRAEIVQRFPGIVLPELELPGALQAADTAAVIEEATRQLQEIATAYQKEVDAVLLSRLQQQADAKATAAMQSWSIGFAARAVRRAADVMAALEPESVFAADQARNHRLGSIVKKARKMMGELGMGDEDLPEAILKSLDEVLVQNDVSSASLALGALAQCVQAERQRQTRRRQEETDRLQQERTSQIAEQIATTLEDMGYQVSGVEDTAYVRSGQLYAWDSDHPNHVLRFTLAREGGQILSEPLRVKNEASDSISQADASRTRQEDVAFDTYWCGKDGHAKFRKELSKRKTTVRFHREHEPGAVTMQTVDEGSLGARISDARQPRIRRDAPKFRTVKPKP